MVKRGGKKEKRKERNPTRPWGFSSQHPRHPLPLKKTRLRACNWTEGRYFGGSRRLERRDRETPRWRIPVLLGFSSFFPFFLFPLSSFLPFFFSPCPRPQPEEEMGSAQRARWGAPRGARRGARGGALGGGAEELGRICTFGGRWHVQAAPAPPKSVR